MVTIYVEVLFYKANCLGSWIFLCETFPNWLLLVRWMDEHLNVEFFWCTTNILLRSKAGIKGSVRTQCRPWIETKYLWCAKKTQHLSAKQSTEPAKVNWEMLNTKKFSCLGKEPWKTSWDFKWEPNLCIMQQTANQYNVFLGNESNYPLKPKPK